MEKEDLRRCQMVQLDIANEIKRICEKHKISYLLIAGSMLGAIRHDGFIPWDDDLDIGMLRNDYERFIHIASVELNDEYFLQTWHSDPCFALPIAKIRKKNTRYVERNSSEVDIVDGIYVDIFPFDNVPTNDVLYKVQKIESKILLHLLLNKNKYNYLIDSTKIKKLSGNVLKFMSMFFSLSFLHDRMEKCMSRYNMKDTTRVVAFGGASRYEKETIKRKWVERTILKEFETTEFNISEYWKDYLEHFYGDYMTPPPIEHRYDGHNILLVKFENGDFWEQPK